MLNKNNEEIDFLLDRHQQRRKQRIPTISALVGPVLGCVDYWQRWARTHKLSTTLTKARLQEELVKFWLAKLIQEENIYSYALSFLAKQGEWSLEQCRARLRGFNAYELNIFWQATDISVLSGKAQKLLRYLTENITQDKDIELEQIQTINESNPGTIFAALAEIVPVTQFPTLLVEVGTSNSTTDTFITLADIASSLPELPLAIAIEPNTFKAYLSSAAESHAKALLREGVIEIPSLTKPQLKELLSKQPEKLSADTKESFYKLAEQGATANLLEEFLVVANKTQDISTKATKTERDAARSEAERYIFARLESQASTSGIFELNGKLREVTFGNRPMEIDMLARYLKVAIEIDGYYHFQKPENYRRDRAKDFLLQKEGFLVLRFLAEDVVKKQEAILATIDEALEHQQSCFNAENVQ